MCRRKLISLPEWKQIRHVAPFRADEDLPNQKIVQEEEEGNKERQKRREKRISLLVGAMSSVNHKRLHQGWKHTSDYLLLIPHKSQETAKIFKIHKISLDTNVYKKSETIDCRRSEGKTKTTLRLHRTFTRNAQLHIPLECYNCYTA